MWGILDELDKNPKDRKKKVIQRTISKIDPNSTNWDRKTLKKDDNRTKTHQDDMHKGTNTNANKKVHNSSRYSADMAKQIYQQDILLEKPTPNRHSSSSSITPEYKNNPRESTISNKSSNAPISDEASRDPIVIDKKKKKKNEKRESVDVAKSSRQSNFSDEKPVISRDIGSSYLTPPPQQQHDNGETSNVLKKYNQSSMLIEYDTEPSMLIKHKTQRVSNMHEQVEQPEQQYGGASIKVTTEPLLKQNKTYIDNLQLSDLSDPYNFKHESGYSLNESEFRSGRTHIERPSEKTHEQNFLLKSGQQEVVETTVIKAKTEKTGKVKKGDVSTPITLEHTSGFSKLGVSHENFNVDHFLTNKELQRRSGLPEIKEREISTPNSKSDYMQNYVGENPGEQCFSERLKNRSREEHFEKVVQTLAGGNEILYEDIDERQEGTDQIKEEIHEARLENVHKDQKPKKSKKIKTGKLKKSEIGDPVNYNHVSGYTKVDDTSENELSDDQLWSDDGGLTDDDSCGPKKEEKMGMQESNEKMPTTVKDTKENPRKNKKVIVKKGDVSGPFKIEHVSGFSKLHVSVDNFDIDRYADNPEVFAQLVSKEVAITKEHVYQRQETSDAFPTHNSEGPSIPVKNKLLTGETNDTSSNHIEPNYDVKQIQIIDVQENTLKENTERVNIDGRSQSVNCKHFAKYTKELSDKDIEKNNDYLSSENQESDFDSGIARYKTLDDLKVQHNAKEITKEEKEIVKKNIPFSDPVEFQHIDGFSKLGIPLESFEVNSYVEKKLLLVQSGESDSNVIKDPKTYVVKNSKMSTKTQKVKKHKTGKINKDELSDPVNFHHVLGYSKDQGSDNEEWSDIDIPLCSESNVLEYEDNMNNVGQGSSYHGDVAFVTAQSTPNEPQENVNEKHSEISPPSYTTTLSIITVNSERTMDEESESTRIHREVQLIPDNQSIVFKSVRKNKGRRNLKKEDIGQPQDMRHTYGHSKHNFLAGCQTFDKRILEIEYKESLVQAFNSDIKSPDNKARLFIQHIPLKSEDLSHNSSEDDMTSEHGTSLPPRRSIDSNSTSDTTGKPNLSTTEPNTNESEAENIESIYEVGQTQEEEHHSDNLEDLDLFQQIRQGPVLKSVTASRNTKVYKTVDNKDTISSVNQMEKEKEKADSPPHEENIVSPALKTAPAIRNTKVSRTTETDSPAGQMSEVLGKRSRAFFPESSDSEYDDNLSEGETCV